MAEYIDREALIDCLRKERSEIEIREDDDKAFNLGVHQGYVFAIHDAKSIPAADVRPVVRAHWTDHRTVEHDGEWYCTACGKEITIYMGADRKDRYAYCPNCGARMEES